VAGLVIVTLIAGGYLYFTNRSSGGLANDYASVNQRIATAARSLPVAAQKVQRFDDAHVFDQYAIKTINEMIADRALLEKMAKTQSGSSRQIVERGISAANQAINAALKYRYAIAVSYELRNADSARSALFRAASELDAAAQAWQQH